MKNLITNILLFTIIFFAANTLAQRQWIQQNSGTTSNLMTVDFIDENIGFAVGRNPDILIKTTNGGIDWQNPH